MPRRQDRFGVTIPATTARVVDTAVEILGDPDPSEMAFLHSVLAQTFLPYRDPKTRDYVRENGRASMVSAFLPERRIFDIPIPSEHGSSHVESF